MKSSFLVLGFHPCIVGGALTSWRDEKDPGLTTEKPDVFSLNWFPRLEDWHILRGNVIKAEEAQERLRQNQVTLRFSYQPNDSSVMHVDFDERPCPAKQRILECAERVACRTV